jgi:hypothetical protein
LDASNEHYFESFFAALVQLRTGALVIAIGSFVGIRAGIKAVFEDEEYATYQWSL